MRERNKSKTTVVVGSGREGWRVRTTNPNNEGVGAGGRRGARNKYETAVAVERGGRGGVLKAKTTVAYVVWRDSSGAYKPNKTTEVAGFLFLFG